MEKLILQIDVILKRKNTWHFCVNDKTVAVIHHFPFMAYKSYSVEYLGTIKKNLIRHSYSYNTFNNCLQAIVKKLYHLKAYTNIRR